MSSAGGVDTLSELRPGHIQQMNMSSIPRGPAGPPSEASTISTALASEVGSFVHHPKDAFLRSFTFYRPKRRTNRGILSDINYDDDDDDGEGTRASSSSQGRSDWILTLRDPPAPKRRRRAPSFAVGRSQPKLLVDGVGGTVALSGIRPGDELRSINGKKIGPSYNADRAMLYLDRCWKEDGYLSVAVGNGEGDDILVQVTVIKPRPDMSYADLGMVVWKWGVLCIHQIDKDSVSRRQTSIEGLTPYVHSQYRIICALMFVSYHHHSFIALTCVAGNQIFKKTVLKEADHIISVNDIACDEMTPEGFAHVVNELPREIRILVRRGRQRWSGKFG
jgi:hypothetical protein